jgi:hypothetical protein
MNSKTKNALKGIVKECLIEILAEGLVGNNTATIREKRELKGSLHESSERLGRQSIREASLAHLGTQSNKTDYQKERPRNYLDSITMGVENSKIPEDNERIHINKTVANLTNDAVMSDILADTAMTTLKEQKQGSRPSGPSVMANGDEAARIASQSDPMELFGGTASNWANLAFSPSLRQK